MVLEDHVRRGKRLVPRLLTKINLRSSTWHIERLPDLFWLAFVGNRIGHKRTFDLARDMSRSIEGTFRRMRNVDRAFRAYVASEHYLLEPDECRQVATEHVDSQWLRALDPHFRDMVRIWPALPFGYLVGPQNREADKPLISEVKELLRECYDRHDKLALIIQATTVGLELETGHLTLASGLSVPNLNAIFNYPNTDESKNVAGFVVSSCHGVVMDRNGPLTEQTFRWQRAFWNSCFHLEPENHE